MRLPKLLATLVAAAPLLLVSSSAFAWKHTGFAWCDDGELPIPYYVGDYVEDSLPEGATLTILADSYAAWPAAAPCAGVGGTFMGMCDNTPFILDYQNRDTFDDPADELDAGVLGLTQSRTQGDICFVENGQVYYHLSDTDIQFNNDIDWALDSEIDGGQCNGETSLQAVATHEIGHSLGLDHSCEQNEVCTDQDLAEATMFWSTGACDDHGSTPNDDDKESINHLYGPHADVVCNHELDPNDPDTLAFGIVPWTIRCSINSNNRPQITDVTWQWGDGETTLGLDVEHTYTTEGNFTVQVLVDGESDSCGAWASTTRKVGYVRSCDVPKPEFTASHVNGLEYEFRNDTNVSTYGCIFNIEWDVFEAGGTEPIAELSAWEPKFTFPDAGDYHIVLNVGGPAGTGAADITMTAENTRGEGYGSCSTAPADLGAVALLVGLLALRRRRSS
jgi:MYXO-CTERM domain-containing protein